MQLDELERRECITFLGAAVFWPRGAHSSGRRQLM